jgi:hypothetical protein
MLDANTDSRASNQMGNLSNFRENVSRVGVAKIPLSTCRSFNLGLSRTGPDRDPTLEASSWLSVLVERWTNSDSGFFRDTESADEIEGHSCSKARAASPTSSGLLEPQPSLATLSSSFVKRLVRRSLSFFASSALLADEAAAFTAAAICFL